MLWELRCLSLRLEQDVTSNLLVGIKTSLALETSPIRSEVYLSIRQRSVYISMADTLFHVLKNYWLGPLMLLVYGLHSFLSVANPTNRGRIYAAGKYRNEKLTAAEFADMVGKNMVAYYSYKFRLNLKFSKSSLTLLRRIFRIACRLVRRYDFMPACRAFSTLCYYLRFRELLSIDRPDAVFIASMSSPDSLGLRAAAENSRISTIFMPHAAIPSNKGPRLNFTWSVLPGKAALRAFKDNGRVKGNVIFSGIPGLSRPLRFPADHAAKTVGFFLTALTDIKVLQKQIFYVREHLPDSKIVIRPHPLALVNPNFGSLRGACSSEAFEISKESLFVDIDRCDLVVIGNSSVLLQVLKSGTVAVVLKGLDRVPDDYYGFCRNGIAPVIESLAQLNLAQLKLFFDQAWADRFRQYDHSYLMSQDEVRRTMLGLVEEITPGMSETKQLSPYRL